jgi:hypothetical protein
LQLWEFLVQQLQLDSTAGRLDLENAAITLVQAQFRRGREWPSFRDDHELTGPQPADDGSPEDLSRPEA